MLDDYINLQNDRSSMGHPIPLVIFGVEPSSVGMKMLDYIVRTRKQFSQNQDVFFPVLGVADAKGHMSPDNKLPAFAALQSGLSDYALQQILKYNGKFDNSYKDTISAFVKHQHQHQHGIGGCGHKHPPLSSLPDTPIESPSQWRELVIELSCQKNFKYGNLGTCIIDLSITDDNIDALIRALRLGHYVIICGNKSQTAFDKLKPYTKSINNSNSSNVVDLRSEIKTCSGNKESIVTLILHYIVNYYHNLYQPVDVDQEKLNKLRDTARPSRMFEKDDDGKRTGTMKPKYQQSCNCGDPTCTTESATDHTYQQMFQVTQNPAQSIKQAKAGDFQKLAAINNIISQPSCDIDLIKLLDQENWPEFLCSSYKNAKYLQDRMMIILGLLNLSVIQGSKTRDELGEKFRQRIIASGGCQIIEDARIKNKDDHMSRDIIQRFQTTYKQLGLWGRCCSNVQCKKQETDGTTFKHCSACGRVAYCSVDCQKVHWKAEHKTQCKLLAASK